jgi:hypothetical protein
MVAAGVLLLAAVGATAEAEPAPQPQPRATISAARPVMVLGAEREMPLSIEIAGNDAAVPFMPERALASAGTVRDVVTAGPNRFTAVYLPPATRFPQVAILVIDFAGAGQHLRAALHLPLHAAADLPFRATPSSQVTVTIAGRTFGPVRADAQGHVRLPIVVPPGVREGVARAVDEFGGARETPVDLQPAPFTRLLIAAPPQIEVGSFVEISVFAADPVGQPMPAGGRVTLQAAGLMVHPLGHGGPGEERFLLEAPARLAAGPLQLVSTARDDAGPTPPGPASPPPPPTTTTTAAAVPAEPPARAALTVPLVAGPPARLILVPSVERLIVGGGAIATVTLAARDRLDNPTSCAGATVEVEHAPAAIDVSGGGYGTLRIAAPARPTGKNEIAIAATLGGARAASRIKLVAGPAARLVASLSAARVVGDGRRSVEVRVDAFDKSGLPTAVPELHWRLPEARLGQVRFPHTPPAPLPDEVAPYIAQVTPDRAQVGHDETLVVTAEPQLEASLALHVDPPRSRVAVAARIGLFSNFAAMAGPVASIEALTGLPGRAAGWSIGLGAAYLRNDMTATLSTGAPDDPNATGALAAHIEIDQVPVLAIVRYRLPLPFAAEVAVGGAAGLSFARATFTAPLGNASNVLVGTARAPAFELRSDVAFPLSPGELVVGLHYLWIDIGRTSSGDEVNGNSAGLVGDLGFRVTW